MNKIGNRIKKLEDTSKQKGIDESIHITLERAITGHPELTTYRDIVMGKNGKVGKTYKLVNGEKVFVNHGCQDSLGD